MPVNHRTVSGITRERGSTMQFYKNLRMQAAQGKLVNGQVYFVNFGKRTNIEQEE